MSDKNSKVFYILNAYQRIFAFSTPYEKSRTYESIPVLSESTENMLLEKLLESKLVDSIGSIKALFVLNNGDEVQQELLTLDVSKIAKPGDKIKPFYYSYDEGKWYVDGDSSQEYYQLEVESNRSITGYFTLSEALAFEVKDEQYYDDNGIYNFGDEDDGDESAVGDYDYGGLEDGVDPDSVADGDYDFNDL